MLIGVGWTACHDSKEAVVPLEHYVSLVAEGKLQMLVGRMVNRLGEMVEAHKLMSANRAGGKIVGVFT